MSKEFDIFIIGGGINGAGVARDASGRGLKVCLTDKGRIGGATSSWSTKLIHGGLRYLENYEFKLVRDSLKEREIINKIAPNITHPIPFIIPHTRKIRPAWLIKLGLFLYDNIGGKTTIPKSSSIDITKELPGILKPEYKKGFKYYDLQVDDHLLTLMNAKDASNYGAKIIEDIEVVKANREKNYWKILLSSEEVIYSKILINASGPWINDVMNRVIKINNNNSLRLVKGSHIITRKLYDEKIAFTLQNFDKRIIFIIPYKNDFTLIGTTEIEINNPNNPKITDNEVQYLLSAVNVFLINEIKPSDVCDSYAGVRPLIENYNKQATKLTRDYIFDINSDNNMPPLINIYGGKLTTYRKLSENLIENLKPYLGNIKKNWTKDKKLPSV